MRKTPFNHFWKVYTKYKKFSNRLNRALVFGGEEVSRLYRLVKKYELKLNKFKTQLGTAMGFTLLLTMPEDVQAQFAASGSAMRLNTVTVGNQYNPKMASGANGNFISVWQSESSLGSGLFSIKAQILRKDLTFQGGEINISNTANNSINPDVAVDSLGNFVVVWEEDLANSNGKEIFARVYNANGTPKSNSFKVNTATAQDQVSPSVDMDDNGDFVVVWLSEQYSGYSNGIYARRYNINQIPITNEFTVSTTNAANLRKPDVASGNNGRFVVTYANDGDNSGKAVYGVLYNNNTIQKSEFRINTYTTNNQQNPSVAMNSKGNFVVAWESWGQDFLQYNVYANKYNAVGDPENLVEFQVVSNTAGSHQKPSVQISEWGTYVISYEDPTLQIGARVYGPGASSEFSISTNTINSKSATAVAMDSDGDFLIAWQENTFDGSGFGINTQAYKHTLNYAPQLKYQEFFVNKNTSVGSVVGKIWTKDPNQSDLVNMVLQSSDFNDLFIFEPDGDIVLNNVVDINAKLEYVFTVQATDNAVPALSRTQNYRIALVSSEPEFPNAFSPNNDGLNDNFYIYFTDPSAEKSIHIYDRDGILVFTKSSNGNLDDWWDGSYQDGRKAGDGTYYFVFQQSGNPNYIKKGSLELRR